MFQWRQSDNTTQHYHNVNSRNVSPHRGEKPKNRPVSKTNTGRAAQRADPAGNNNKLLNLTITLS